MVASAEQSASSANPAIQVKLNIHSANIPLVRRHSFIKEKLVQPTSYVSLSVSEQTNYTSTAKSRQATTNPQWDENIMIVVKPTSTVKFFVMSYHKSQPDRLICSGRMKISEIINKFPSEMPVANHVVTLTVPNVSDMQNVPLETVERSVSNIKLNVQIKGWPNFCFAYRELSSPTSSNFDRNQVPQASFRNSIPPTPTNPSNDIQRIQSELPDHYEVRIDSNGRMYYLDHLSKTTSWDKPLPLADNWERRFDNVQKRIYYVDHANRTTTWVHPNAASSQAAQQEGYQNYQNRLHHQESIDENDDKDVDNLIADFEVVTMEEIEKVTKKLEYPWEMKTHGTGKQYYVNHRTKTSQWENPMMTGIEMKIPDGWTKKTTHDGTVYYVNHATRQSSWSPWTGQTEQKFVRIKMSLTEKAEKFNQHVQFNIQEGYLKIGYF